MPLIILSSTLVIAALLNRDLLDVTVGKLGTSTSVETLPQIHEIKSYTDADFNFTMAVPVGWNPIIADEPISEMDALETTYAVGFESPRTDRNDRFADYIMVEIIPGKQSGAFETDGSLAKAILIDGFPAKEDQLLLRGYQVASDRLDLQVYQAELFGLGYSVGFYAIGEHREAKGLRDAFRLMIETFKLPSHLFDLS